MRYIIAFVLLNCFLQGKTQIVKTDFITGIPVPSTFAIAPDGRFFVACKGYGGAYAVVKVYDSTGAFQTDLWDFTDSAETNGEKGVIGVTLDPDFSLTHYVYVFYNHLSPAKIRVVRFTESGGVGTFPTVILDIDDPYSSTGHTAGNIHFRPSDPFHLYITIGERGAPADVPLLSTWNGKILRIHKNGSIPTDNPFYDDGDPLTGNDDRIWVLGLRNSFDFCFGPNDTLYATENGVSTYDEINIIRKGRNYGWPSCEGISGSCAGTEPPFEVYGASTPALTGIIFYTSTVIPSLTNKLVVGEYGNNQVSYVELGNAPYYDQFVSRAALPGASFAGVTDLEQGHDGCIYVCELNDGKISKFCAVNGIEEIEARSNYSVFPNPVIDKVQVKGDGVKQLDLFDSKGKMLQTANSATMDVSAFSQGIYLLRVNKMVMLQLVKTE